MIDIKADFGKEIEALWDKHANADKTFKERGFAVPCEIKKGGILFLGINPSFDEEEFKKKPDAGKVFYPLYDEKPHKYFTKFIDIANDLKESWSHIDLLFVRETDQKAVGKLLSGNVDFFYRQLLISKRIIELAKPNVIVVNNTLARLFLGYHQNEEKDKDVWIGFNFDFDENLGTEKIINHEILSGTPVFFTSMLTGQRALDTGSYRRLKWHINFVLDKQKNK